MYMLKVIDEQLEARMSALIENKEPYKINYGGDKMK